MSQSLPRHVVLVDTGGTVLRKHGSHLGKVESKTVVIFVVSNLPGRMKVKGKVLWRSRVIGWQVLSLEFKCGHNALRLFAIKVNTLLPGGLCSIHHRGQGQVGVT